MQVIQMRAQYPSIMNRVSQVMIIKMSGAFPWIKASNHVPELTYTTARLLNIKS